MKIYVEDADPKGENCFNCKHSKYSVFGNAGYTFCEEADGDGFGNRLCVSQYIKCDHYVMIPLPRKPRRIRKL